MNKLILYGEQLNNTTIKWSWDIYNKSPYLIDEENEIIAQCSFNDCFYIENNLEAGKTYKRKLILVDIDEDDLESDVTSITLEKNEEVSELLDYVPEKRNEDIESNKKLIEASRFSAFKSGIGDNNDLKIKKSNDTSYIKRFNLINKIYGIRASKVVKHNTIKFEYRFKLSGVEEYTTFNSSYDIKVTAQKVSNLNTYPNYVLSGPILQSKNVNVKLKDDTYITDFYMTSFINNLVRDYSQRYKYTFKITNVKGGIKVYSQTYGESMVNEGDTLTFEDYGYFDHKINIVAYQKKEKREYVEYYPPLKYEALVGAVNGDFEMSEDGLKTMSAIAPRFETSSYITDKKYYCVIEKTVPKVGSVSYRFKSSKEGEIFTEKNGDNITFSSTSIIEDEKEERFLLSQVEYGELVIKDNVKYSYTYSLDSVMVEEKAYKRFELDVVPSTNDIIVLDNTKYLEIKDGKIINLVTVNVRAIQNAIAKWNPVIHSGYYYQNQEERYLFTNCICNGEDKILQEIYLKPSINVLTLIETIKKAGSIEKYEIKKSSVYDLLNDEKDFYFESNRIYPKHIAESEDRDGVFFYDFKDEYEYTSYPFIFKNKVTSLDEILYSSIENLDNEIMVFISSFNDVIGQYDNPIEIKNKVIPKVNLSKVYKLIFKLYPAKKPNLKSKKYLLNSEWDFIYHCQTEISTSSNLTFEKLVNISSNVEGFYISKYFDLGESNDKINGREIEINLGSIGDYEIFIENTAIKKENSITHKDFEEYSEKITNAKRYFRIKVVAKKNTEISNIEIDVKRYEYVGMDKNNYVPSFGNIVLKATHNPQEVKEHYTDLLTFNLSYDSTTKIYIEDVEEYITNVANTLKFDYSDVSSIKFLEHGDRKDDFECIYEENKLKIKSLKTIFDFEEIEANQGGVEFDFKEELRTKPIIQQFSPIIIYGKVEEKYLKNPLTRVFFVNEETDEFVLENKETFNYEGFKTYYLEYPNIDPSTISVLCDEVSTKDFTLTENILTINSTLENVKVITVRYKIKNSYCINLNYLKDETIINFNTESINKVKVFYETSKSHSERTLKGISLNPIYNSRDGGYIYISDRVERPVRVIVTAEEDFIFANGKDEMYVLVQVLDKYHNPIENVKVNIACSLGKIKKIDKATDINGVLRCKYTSFTGNAIDLIKATSEGNVKGECKIINRKL